jgi:hypothetical protein
MARELTGKLSNSRSETHPEFVQPVPLDAIRCYLLDKLYSGLTCTNGCSCWSPLEGNEFRICRCKRHALPLRHTPINYLSAQLNSGHQSFAVSSVTRPGHLGPAPTGGDLPREPRTVLDHVLDDQATHSSSAAQVR